MTEKGITNRIALIFFGHLKKTVSARIKNPALNNRIDHLFDQQHPGIASANLL